MGGVNRVIRPICPSLFGVDKAKIAPPEQRTGTDFPFDNRTRLPYTSPDRRIQVSDSIDGQGRERSTGTGIRRRRCKVAQALRQKDPDPTKLWKAAMHRRGNPPGRSAAIAVKLSGKRTEARRKRRNIAPFQARLFFCSVTVQKPEHCRYR